MAWVVLIYYFLPERIIGYSRATILMIIVLCVLIFEAIRIYKRWKLFGMRDYERRRIAAYAWATMAAGIALLFFPMHLTALCLIGMGIVDPLTGELRELKPEFYPHISLLTWFVIGMVVLTVLTDFQFRFVLLLSVLGSFVAVVAEKPNIIIDDDFLMIIVPLFVLRAVELIVGWVY